MEYLSPAWLDAAATLVAADEGLAAATADLSLTIQYDVEGTPWGTVTYHLALGEGRARLAAGAAPGAAVRFRCDHATALAVATGKLGAQRAFMDGRLRVGGEVASLVAAQPSLAVVDDVLAPIRPSQPAGEA